MMAIKDGYQQWRKDSKGVLVRWSTTQGWQRQKDDNGARMVTVWGWLSMTAIDNGYH
jgi:hypothetical protein